MSPTAREEAIALVASTAGMTPRKAEDIVRALEVRGMLVGAEGPFFTIEAELSVDGYTSGNPKRFFGTLAGATKALADAFSAFYDKVDENWQERGNHAGFCPQNAEGYPSRDPSNGDVVTCSITKLSTCDVRGGPETAVAHHSKVYGFVRSVASGEVFDPSEKALEVDPRAVDETATNSRGRGRLG